MNLIFSFLTIFFEAMGLVCALSMLSCLNKFFKVHFIV